MGWTSYHANYYKNGRIDRKAECDAMWNNSLDNGRFKVLKSAMVGSVYYAAIQIVKEKNENNEYVEVSAEKRRTIGVVFLTQTDMRNYYNFYYKDMEETMGPGYYDCPKGILDLLTPTDSEYALEWRKKCRENIEKKKKGNSLAKLPYGTKVIWTRWDGKEITLVKRPPAYQFKTWWWQIDGQTAYTKKKYVTEENTRIVA